MNKKWVLASSILALAVANASGQASGGGGGGGGAGGGASGGTGASVGAGTTGGAAASGSTTTTSGTSGQSRTTVNPQTGVQNQQQVPPNRNQLPPGVQNREQLPPGSQLQGQVPPRNVGTNAFTQGFTNQGAFTNGLAGGTNGFGNTNLSPTGRNFTNHTSGTNGSDSRHFDRDHFDRDRFRDEAITPGDQSLLIRIKQTIITEISVSTSGGANWVPIHFSIHSGHVRMMGLVRTADEGQRILAMLSQMPGVSGVDNGLSTLPPDQATTESDRAILNQIRQVIPLQPAPGPWTPISFNVQQGAVGIVGIVPTTQESQRIETTVRQVPGVVRTSNTLIVDASTGANMTPTSR